jgi:hypothetical protein
MMHSIGWLVTNGDVTTGSRPVVTFNPDDQVILTVGHWLRCGWITVSDPANSASTDAVAVGVEPGTRHQVSSQHTTCARMTDVRIR